MPIELPTASDLFWRLVVGACEIARQISMTKNFQRHPTERSVTKGASSLPLPSVLRAHRGRTWLNTPPRRGGLLVRKWLYILSGAFHHATVTARDYKIIYIVAHITMPPLQPMQKSISGILTRERPFGAIAADQ